MAKGKKRGKKSGLANPAALDGSQDTPPPTAGAPIPVAAPQDDPLEMMNIRFRRSSMRQIAIAAKERGLTMKQLVSDSLRKNGVEMADQDLQDGSPKRRFTYTGGP